MNQNLLRSCAGCSAALLTNDGRSERVWCGPCRARYVKPFDEWNAGLKVGDRVYVQPSATIPNFSRSEHIIIERDGDRLVLQPLGWPGKRVETTVQQCGQHDLTPRRP